MKKVILSQSGKSLQITTKNQLVRKQGGGLFKNEHNIEESIYMLLKFAYYEAIGSRMQVDFHQEDSK